MTSYRIRKTESKLYCKYCGHEEHKAGKCEYMSIKYRIIAVVAAAVAAVAVVVVAAAAAAAAAVVVIVAVAVAGIADYILEKGECKCEAKSHV